MDVGCGGLTPGGGHGCEAWGQPLAVVLQLLAQQTGAGACTGGHGLPVILKLHQPASSEQAREPASVPRLGHEARGIQMAAGCQ